jgi:chitinase
MYGAGVLYVPGGYTDATDHTSYVYDDINYYAEELPVYADRYLNLCANIYDSDESTARVLMAAGDGQFDPTAAAITADTAPADYPENVSNLLTFLAEEDWDYYTEYQVQADSDCTEECVGFSTYWDFLTAIAKVPYFCNGTLGAAYGRFSAAAMCAKEFASLVATYITQTGPVYNDLAVLTDADDNEIAAFLSGGQVTEETRCVDGHDNYDADWCTALGYENADGTYAGFYAAKVAANDDIAADNDYYPRGSGYTMGIEKYYWMSQVVYGDDTLMEDPTLLATDPVAFWLSGLMTWMIPMDGRPAPHSIITGQWEPTGEELDMGLTDGMGAVSSLLYGGEQCGMSQHPVANARTEIYDDLMASIEAVDGSWAAADTIYSWEESGCAAVARAEFPADGDYSVMPQFATPAYPVDMGSDLTASAGCFVTDEVTDYIIWQKDAFRNCAIAAKSYDQVLVSDGAVFIAAAGTNAY